MTLTDLEKVKPGPSVGHIRHGRGQLIDIDVARGIVPESSDLADEDARVFVTTDNAGAVDVAIGLENIAEGEADLAILNLDGDPLFNRKLMTEVMRQSDVRVGNLNPELADAPAPVLQAMGFQQGPSGDYTFARI
jgi:hypothetical protein